MHQPDTPPRHAVTDADDLEQFGYSQQLSRSMGSFSSFAVAFALISVFTGVFANFGHGLRQVGGGVVWSWLIVLAGQSLVALVLAELSTRFPLSGYGYQWTARLVNPHAGFFVGWLLTLQFLTGFPGVCATLAAYVGGWLGGGWAAPSSIVALTLAVIAVTSMLHLFGIRLVARVNDAGVWTELVGVAVVSLGLIGLALWTGGAGGLLFDSSRASTGQPAPLGAWALSLLLGAWCLTGFEAAADLAEETHQPRRVVPRAILLSLVSSGVAGALLLAGVVINLPDLAAAQQADNPMLFTLHHALGPTLLPPVLVVVGVAVFACGLASMAATSRLLFALARDRMLPGSTWLAALDVEHRAPRHAILFIWVVSSAVVLVLPTLEVITQISAVAGYLGYAGIVLAAMQARPSGGAHGFSLGRARPFIGGAACLWALGVVAALTVPPTDIDGLTNRYVPAISTGAAICAGLLVYALVVRPRLRRGDAGPPARMSNRHL